jgi:hypothetical protein
VDVYIHVFLTAALVGGEWSASRRGRFAPGERTPDTHWIRGGRPQSRPGLRGEEKILDPTGTGTPTPSSAQPVNSRYTDCAIPAPIRRRVLSVPRNFSRGRGVIPSLAEREEQSCQHGYYQFGMLRLGVRSGV